MKIFEHLVKNGHEELVYFYDDTTGLKTIVAIHNTTLGPALGGTRMWPYANEEEALIDALRLSKGMTMKNAAAGLDLGGGKAVIIGDPQKDKSEEMLRSYGRCIEKLSGKYITAVDVGMNSNDLDIIVQETRHVAGGFIEGGVDTSVATARGVWRGIQAAAKEFYGNDSLEGLDIVVQGLGKVGYNLCRFLSEDGANLIVADINREIMDAAVREFQAKPAELEKVYEVKCHVYAPCALGGVINQRTIPKLNCDIIAGSANNVLENEKAGDAVTGLGILYIPDYIINAGGVINAAEGIDGQYDSQRVIKKLDNIYNTVLEVIQLAQKFEIATYQAADWLANKRIKEMANL